MRFPKLFLLVAALGTFLAVSSLEAASSTLYVNDDGAPSVTGKNCSKPNFNTVQAAVTAASPGDRVVVCEGTYTEQVVINKSIELSGQGDAVIKAPALMLDPIKAIVRVTGAGTNATIEKLTISGPGGGPCNSLRVGIRVDDAAHANIIQNHITEIRDDPFSGCQNGQAIFVGRQFDGTTGTALIKQNLIDKYQKGGIVVDNVGSSAEISHNTIIGVGPTAAIAQNGIQVSRGATGNVQHNSVSGNVYTGPDDSTGILLFQPGAVTVSNNTVSANDTGIYLGILVFGGGTTGAEISHNKSSDNVVDGIFVDSDSTGNTLTNNQMSNNGEHDAHDESVGLGTAGTGNAWTKNKCDTSSPNGLCN